MTTSTVIVNLFGGPGIGKSTLAAGLYYKLKVAGIESELVTEFAKELVWERNYHLLEDQISIFAEQRKRIERCVGNVKVVVTDSPCNLIMHYARQYGFANEHFFELVRTEFSNYNNLNILLQRNDAFFKKEGRMQTLDEAKEIDEKLVNLLEQDNLDYTTVNPASGNPLDEIFNIVVDRL